MKIAVAAILTLLVVSAGLVYLWNQGQNPPHAVAELGPELEESTVVYDIIEDTPLVIVDQHGVLYLDTIERELPLKKWPPGPVWELTGGWFELGAADLVISADLTSQFGPRVLFGVIRDNRVTHAEIQRDGVNIQTLEISSPGFILPGDSAKYADDIVFLDGEGVVIEIGKLEQKSYHAP